MRPHFRRWAAALCGCVSVRCGCTIVPFIWKMPACTTCRRRHSALIKDHKSTRCASVWANIALDECPSHIASKGTRRLKWFVHAHTRCTFMCAYLTANHHRAGVWVRIDWRQTYSYNRAYNTHTHIICWPWTASSMCALWPPPAAIQKIYGVPPTLKWKKRDRKVWDMSWISLKGKSFLISENYYYNARFWL